MKRLVHPEIFIFDTIIIFEKTDHVISSQKITLECTLQCKKMCKIIQPWCFQRNTILARA